MLKLCGIVLKFKSMKNQPITVVVARCYAQNSYQTVKIAECAIPVDEQTTVKQMFGAALEKLCFLVPMESSKKKILDYKAKDGEEVPKYRKPKGTELFTTLHMGNEQIEVLQSTSFQTPYSDSPTANKTFVYKLLEGFKRLQMANGVTLESGAKFLDTAADKLSKGQRVTKAEFQTMLAQSAAKVLDVPLSEAQSIALPVDEVKPAKPAKRQRAAK